MRLIAVHIEKFGQFHDQKFRFPDDSFVIIQGHNESGKSTLIQFIKYMLFGFPSRSNLKSLGLLTEDDEVGMGGEIEIEHPTIGRFSLVRHLRKSSGEVTIYLDNGEVKEESFLKEWFEGMDLALYESIFSLELDGLKDLHKLKPETLQHYLFSTGMMGNAGILELEKRLDKEALDRFKPMGKNPLINQTLSELEGLKNKLKVWDLKWDHYLLLKEEKEALSKKEELLRQKRKEKIEERQLFTEYKAIEPTLIRVETLRELLSTFPSNVDHFPQQGKERYESWRTQMVALAGEKSDLEREIKEKEQEKKRREESIDLRLVQEKETIQQFVEDEKRLQYLHSEIGKIEERIEQERRALQSIVNRFDRDYTLELGEEAFEKVDTGLQLKHELKASLQDIERMEQELIFIQRNIVEMQQSLHSETTEQHVSKLTEEEKQVGERLDSLFQRKELRDQEIDFLQNELKGKRRTGHLKKNLNSISKFVLTLIGILILGTAGVKVWIHGAWWGVGFGLLILTLLFWGGLQLFLKLIPYSKLEMERMESRLFELKQDQDALQTNESLLRRYQFEKQLEEGNRNKKESQDSLKRKIQIKLNEQDDLLKLKEKREKQLREWLCSKGYPNLKILNLSYDYVELMEQAKQKAFFIQSLKASLLELLKGRDRVLQQAQDFIERLGIDSLTLYDMKHLLGKIEDFEREHKQDQQSMYMLKKQIRSLDERIARFQKECYNLWEQAGVESEDSYYQLGELWNNKQQSLREFEEVNQTLKTVQFNSEQLNLFKNWLKESKWGSVSLPILNEDLKAIEDELEDLQKSLQDVNLGIRQVEEDEQHAELFHQYERLIDKLNQEAREWAIYRTAKGLLSKTKELYKANRLPKLIKITQNYFKDITHGAYVHLYYHEGDGFSVEHKNGSIFKVEELSRGTAEQLYVSIRLGLIQLFELPIKLPILVDDGFVNFDEERLGHVMGLLDHISNERQVLFLTCHSSQKSTLRMEEWKEKDRKVAN